MNMIISDLYAEISVKAEKAIAQLELLLEKGKTLAISTSLGKDSSVILVLALEALRRRVADGTHVDVFYVSHANTSIENPAISAYCEEMLTRVELFAAQHGLPVKIVVTVPPLLAQFTSRTVGKGTLPVFPGDERKCSIDWKIKPQQAAVNALLRQVQSPNDLVTVVGTRIAESDHRKRSMEARGETSAEVVQHDDGTFKFPVIADWQTDDVWMLLMACDRKRQGLYQTYVEDFELTLALYRDAHEGACVAVLGEAMKSSPCSARFGCGVCLASGSADKSLSAMINSAPERYGYLEGLNAFRTFLFNTRWDMDRRSWIGKQVSPAGFVQIRPAGYSPEMCRDLLRYLVTLDAQEVDRADEHDTRMCRGELPDNDDNRRLAGPMFQLITAKQLVTIDFLWSLREGFGAFDALKIWHDIWVKGERYPVPDVEPFLGDGGSLPSKRWFEVDDPEFSNEEGLGDAYLEATNRERYPHRPAMRTNPQTGRQIVYYDEADAFTVDGADALLFLDGIDDSFIEMVSQLPADTTAKYYLNTGMVQIKKGMGPHYDKNARCSQYWNQWRENLGATDLYAFAYHAGISDAEHQRRLADVPDDSEEEALSPTMDLFAS